MGNCQDAAGRVGGGRRGETLVARNFRRQRRVLSSSGSHRDASGQEWGTQRSSGSSVAADPVPTEQGRRRVGGAAGRRADRPGDAGRRAGRLDPPVLVLLDEPANICRIADLPQLYSHLDSRGIVVLTILQSYAQRRGVGRDRDDAASGGGSRHPRLRSRYRDCPVAPGWWRPLAIVGAASGLGAFAVFYDGQVRLLAVEGAIGAVVSLILLVTAIAIPGSLQVALS